jgi:DNA-binding transcriptional ArsR family regulator
MHDVFSALADPVRRRLLERLQAHGGQTIRQLRARSAISRQGLAKHLAVLVAADLVVVKRVKREKLHIINTKAIREIVSPWLAAFVPPPAPTRETTEQTVAQVAPKRPRKPKKLQPASGTGHGKWDPGREVPLWEARTRMEAQHREWLRARDT